MTSTTSNPVVTPLAGTIADQPRQAPLSALLEPLIENLPVLDCEVISRLRSFDPEGKRGLVRRLVALYLESAPGVLADIRHSHEISAKQDLRYQAHKFKTSNANIGLPRMHALLEKLEQNLVNDADAGSGGASNGSSGGSSSEISGRHPYPADLITLIESEGARAIEAVRSLESAGC